MLKNISPLLSPELLKILAEMGHGDDIVLADANFPGASSQATNIIRLDGVNIPHLLKAVLYHLPVDTFVPKPISMMSVAAGDQYTPEIWQTYFEIFSDNDIDKNRIEFVAREEYYKLSDQAYCVVVTGERARYGNIIIKKGVID